MIFLYKLWLAFFLYIDFLQKTKKNWRFLRTKKKQIMSALFLLLIMIQIQFFSDKITKILVKSVKIPNFS